MTGAFARPESALQASAALAGVAALVSSLEWLAIGRELGPRGCFAWQLSGSRSFLLRHAAVGRALAVIFETPGVLVLLAARAAAATALVVAAVAGAPLPLPLVIVAVTTLAFTYRGIYGRDGSDQMIALIVVALAIGTILDAARAAAVFVALQAVAAYFVAGVAKLRGREWRSGTAIPLILSTRSYGAPPVGAVLRASPAIGRAATWATMAFEVLFPLSLLAPPAVVLGVLAAGAVFHLTTAVTMGLNVFVWAFVACYPCVIYLAHQV